MVNIGEAAVGCRMMKFNGSKGMTPAFAEKLPKGFLKT